MTEHELYLLRRAQWALEAAAAVIAGRACLTGQGAAYLGVVALVCARGGTNVDKPLDRGD